MIRVIKLFSSFCFLIFIIGCKNVQDEVVIVPDLQDKIARIIEEYSVYVDNKQQIGEYYDPPVYEIIFNDYDGECYLIIGTNTHYKSDLNGYTFIDGKLVTINNADSECNDGWVMVNKLVNDSELSGYKNDKSPLDNYNPAYWVFKIENGRLLQDTQGRLKIDF